MSGTGQPSRLSVVLAFAAIYFIWGSTYLGIRFAIETIPPFFTAGTRFLVAGAILYAWSRGRGAARPSPRHWRNAAIVGVLMLTIGNGGVTWAEGSVNSGTTALVVATVPLWLVVLAWIKPGGSRPRALEFAGIALGLAGVAVLVRPEGGQGDTGGYLAGCAMLNVSALSWAIGTLYAREAELPASTPLATAMEMLCGGAVLMTIGLGSGEASRFSLADVSSTSLLALLYLIGFGSLIGFSAYVWLLGVVSPASVGTYAYVNPVVAVLLGWAIASEPLTSRAGVAVVMIIGGLALIGRAKARRSTAPAPIKPPDAQPAALAAE